MAVLCKPDIIKAISDGRFILGHKGQSVEEIIGDYSIDIGIGKLFKLPKENAKILADSRTRNNDWIDNLTQTEFKNQFLEQIPIPEEGVIIGSEQLFVEPNIDFFNYDLSHCSISTRSSYARMGLHTVNNLGPLNHTYNPLIKNNSRPLFLLASFGPIVRLYQDEAIAQLVLEDPPIGKATDEDLKHLIESSNLQILKHGARDKTTVQELKIDQGIYLTMAKDIWIYRNGTVLHKGIDMEKGFEKFQLPTDPKDAKLFAKNTFFISSSQEYIRLAPSFVGYVQQGVFVKEAPGYQSHPNAPWIWPWPSFEGTITFEGVEFFGRPLYEGCFQSKLHIDLLTSPYASEKRSRYSKQDKATLSRNK
ncbi:hypothetical protein HOA92_05460 [archaeon]|jgi:deoxycytidine triphosphate deaminase|nr:hypothetical protein [archaeon]MBT6762460.1 hypothetical protein [archaeon]